MGRNFVTGSSQYLDNASAPVTAVPLTMACWFKATSIGVGTDRALMFLANDTSTNLWFGMECYNGPLAVSTQGAVYAEAQKAGITVGPWFHGAGVWASAASRTAYLNGVAGTTETTSATPSGINRTSVGRMGRSSGAQLYYDGLIAEPAIWNVALTAREILALATGVRASMIRPESRVFYPPLDGVNGPEPDFTSGHRNLTVTGATAAAHPPVQPFLIPLAMAA